VSVTDAAHAGNTGASVALIQYFDFQCPFCKKFALEIWPQLKSKYVDSGRVMMVWRHLPLQNHALARPAAELAACAERFGKFAAAHDILFRADQLQEAMDTLPAALGLSGPSFDSCRTDGATATVSHDVTAAQALHISSTPAFLVGTLGANQTVKVTGAIRGARPLAEFERALDDALQRSSASRNDR
jgi:protein-disulfide isomerase